ncbi:MAG: hypothetical protein A3J94_16035 [Syntrophus sp. RIFOXYC2_FULL_54_9]|nr:MAG: hypothetical protein A2X92_05165 [Syntrophus sp. GWC2_56_31]OHE33813.1 MAG: hypothetical protein A3J94_16035 [Syntrophus sp. RIFOXYC2_FULL_54_9]HBB16186.1 hypothetical protein [Syntrophus sp. (in: bacteria)]
MIIFNGQTYFTIIDAAAEFGVSAKTIRQYIAKEIIPEPPVIQFGIRQVKHFPKAYMDIAKERLKHYRTARNGSHVKSQNSLLLDL